MMDAAASPRQKVVVDLDDVQAQALRAALDTALYHTEHIYGRDLRGVFTAAGLRPESAPLRALLEAIGMPGEEGRGAAGVEGGAGADGMPSARPGGSGPGHPQPGFGRTQGMGVDKDGDGFPAVGAPAGLASALDLDRPRRVPGAPRAEGEPVGFAAILARMEAATARLNAQGRQEGMGVDELSTNDGMRLLRDAATPERESAMGDQQSDVSSQHSVVGSQHRDTNSHHNDGDSAGGRAVRRADPSLGFAAAGTARRQQAYGVQPGGGRVAVRSYVLEMDVSQAVRAQHLLLGVVGPQDAPLPRPGDAPEVIAAKMLGARIAATIHEAPARFGPVVVTYQDGSQATYTSGPVGTAGLVAARAAQDGGGMSAAARSVSATRPGAGYPQRRGRRGLER